jgi:hypothetical protein
VDGRRQTSRFRGRRCQFFRSRLSPTRRRRRRRRLARTARPLQHHYRDTAVTTIVTLPPTPQLDSTRPPMSVATPSSKDNLAPVHSATGTTAVDAVASPLKTNDLTAHLIPHLDRHLVLPLLDFLESRGAYSHEEVLNAKYDLLKPTNMVTFVLGLKREIDGTSEDADVPAGESRF